MDSLKFGQDATGVWHCTQAPHQIELTLSEICGANPDIIHAEGPHHLVVCNEVWYAWVGTDLDRGVILCIFDRDERKPS